MIIAGEAKTSVNKISDPITMGRPGALGLERSFPDSSL